MTTAERSFRPTTYTPRESRRFVRDVLEVWHCDDLGRVAELLTSELVTNVVMHALTEVSVQLTLETDRVKVAVKDGSAVVPAIRDLATGPGGYGLRLIEELAEAWGVEPTADGKAVWFALARGEPARV